MIDTCQANTMYSKFYSPNIIATGSSDLGQSSYSHHADNDVGVAVIDRYTYYNLDFLETQVRERGSKKTLGDLFDSYDEEKIHSHPGLRWDLFPGGEEAGRNRLIMDFFGNVQGVEVGGPETEADLGIRPNGTEEAEWKEDLLALGKKIRELRERADAQDAAKQAQEARASPQEQAGEEPTATPEAKPSRKQQVRIRAAKVSDDEKYWGKKIVGGLALGGLGLAWAAGSYFEAL